MKPWMPEQLVGADTIAGHPQQAVWNAFIGMLSRPLDLPTAIVLSASRGTKPAPGERLMHIETSMPPGTVLCRLLQFPFAQLTGSELEASDIDALPQPLAEAISKGVLSVVTGMLPPDWTTGSSLLGLANSDDVAGIDEWFDVTLAKPDMPATLLKLGFRRTWLLAVFAKHMTPGMNGAGPLSGTLPIPADITLGRLALSIKEIGQIEQGDVVVMAETPADAVSIRVGNRIIVFFPSDGQYVCTASNPIDGLRPASFRSEMTAMADIEPEIQPSTEDHPGGLADLVLAVDFDIGRVEVPMATVAGWTPGTLVQMEQPALDAGVTVTIRINGQAVGTGDIVRIDNRIGVRITRLIS
ncbi:MAG: FliM/FliN family flagellar motor switch protein [Allorhizobium sp.]